MSQRVRVLVCFAAFGAFWGAWDASLPAIARSARVSDAELGLALLLVGVGALASMPVTGGLFDRRGVPVTAAAVATFGVCAILPAFARSPVALCAALALLGVASGAMDVAINAEAVHEEERSSGPLLHLAHAAFSAAVVAAACSPGCCVRRAPSPSASWRSWPSPRSCWLGSFARWREDRRVRGHPCGAPRSRSSPGC